MSVFRGPSSEGYPFENPYQVDFLVVAAYNAAPGKEKFEVIRPSVKATGSAVGSSPGDSTPSEFTPEGFVRTLRKLHSLLAVAAEGAYDVVVLGALGCGAFRNPCEEVARMFAELLCCYAGCFSKIVFAVPAEIPARPGSNYEVFKRILCANGNDASFTLLSPGNGPVDALFPEGKMCHHAALCTDQDDPEHSTKYGHPLPCTMKHCPDDSTHRRMFRHKTPCPAGGECSTFWASSEVAKAHQHWFEHPPLCLTLNCRLTDPAHRRDLLHPPICDQGMKCKKISEHGHNFRHLERPCDFGLCDALQAIIHGTNLVVIAVLQPSKTMEDLDLVLSEMFASGTFSLQKSAASQVRIRWTSTQDYEELMKVWNNPPQGLKAVVLHLKQSTAVSKIVLQCARMDKAVPDGDLQRCLRTVYGIHEARFCFAADGHLAIECEFSEDLVKRNNVTLCGLCFQVHWTESIMLINPPEGFEAEVKAVFSPYGEVKQISRNAMHNWTLVGLLSQKAISSGSVLKFSRGYGVCLRADEALSYDPIVVHDWSMENLREVYRAEMQTGKTAFCFRTRTAAQQQQQAMQPETHTPRTQIYAHRHSDIETKRRRGTQIWWSAEGSVAGPALGSAGEG